MWRFSKCDLTPLALIGECFQGLLANLEFVTKWRSQGTLFDVSGGFSMQSLLAGPASAAQGCSESHRCTVLWAESGFRVLVFVFSPPLKHAEVPRPGIEPEPQQWQCWILNPLSHQGTPSLSFPLYLTLPREVWSLLTNKFCWFVLDKSRVKKRLVTKTYFLVSDIPLLIQMIVSFGYMVVSFLLNWDINRAFLFCKINSPSTIKSRITYRTWLSLLC